MTKLILPYLGAMRYDMNRQNEKDSFSQHYMLRLDDVFAALTLQRESFDGSFS
jgi:hypothetical protein